MAKTHVIAYFMHETEQADAQQALSSAQTTDSFVIGDIEESAIPALERKGLIVQRQPVAPSPPDAPISGQAMSLDASISGFGDGMSGMSGLNDAFPQLVDYYAVYLNGPLLESSRSQLEAVGVRLLESLPDGIYKYKARLSTQQVVDVSSLPFVRSVEWITPESSAPQVISQSVTPGIGQPPVGGIQMLTFDVRLHDPADLPKIRTWLQTRNLTIAGTSSRKIRFYVAENSPVLDDLAALAEVDKVDEFIAPVLYNNVSRRILGVDPLPGIAPAMALTQDGSNQIVAVADTGIDDQHPDFQGRILKVFARGRPNDATDLVGHGTHVAGSVLGDGKASGGKIKGIASKAKLVFQSLTDANGKLTGLPVDLNDLFEEAYQAGARIHNNSWGSQTPSFYTVNSEEADEFVHKNKDMLLVVAAGNAGTSGQQPKKADVGFVDWLSIGSPATCKNALTVGASRSDRTDGPMATITWAQGWPSAFPVPPIANALVSGDANSMAAFSGRGPCDDRRIKPDVVAPGTDILSTRSSLAPIANFWGAYPTQGQPKDPHYAFDGGTSMATPLVAGCAALVRQYYTEHAKHLRPSAALLKATLINSTTWLTGQDATAKSVGKPNFHQGHGRVSMNLAIPNPSQPGMELRFVDEWETFQFTRTGQRKRYQFMLPADVAELRFCLAYTDAPARSLQNNVNLVVQYIDGGIKFMGNAELPDALTLPDPDNNVESVKIPDAKKGTYFIQVFAANLLTPPQDFALVVAGVGVPPLTEVF